MKVGFAPSIHAPAEESIITKKNIIKFLLALSFILLINAICCNIEYNEDKEYVQI